MEEKQSKKPKITKRQVKKLLKSYLMLTIGVGITAFAYTFLLKPYLFDIGGVSGIGVILEAHGYDSALWIFIINVVLLLLALLLVGKSFFIRNIYGSLLYPVFIKLFDFLYAACAKAMPSIQTDINIIFVSIFSSVIMGFGLGLCVKFGGSTGGTEIPQKILYDKLHIPYNLSLYFFDGIVILLGIFLIPSQRNDINLILGEVVFLLTNGIVMDMTIFGGLNKRCVYIISEKWDEIKTCLLTQYDRGVTRINVVGEYSNIEKKMIFCVMSSIEYNKLREDINKIDPKAFLFCTHASEVRGEGFTYDFEDTKDN